MAVAEEKEPQQEDVEANGMELDLEKDLADAIQSVLDSEVDGVADAGTRFAW